jgi:membrane protease YdiL (CAAX protease family)
MQPYDPAFKPPENTSTPSNGELPPLVLRADPPTLQAPSDDLPPLVLRVDPATLQPVSPPRPPHPGFWWAVLWCIGFLIFTQLVPAILVPVVVIAVQAMRAPDPSRALDRLQSADGMAELKELMLPFLLGASVLSGVLTSYVVIRLIVGKDWKRQLAVRLPSAPQVILVLLAMPAVMVLGDLVHRLAIVLLKGLSFQDWGIDDAQVIMQQVSDWPVWLGVLVIGLGPALGEELWCRGFLGRGLVGRFGPVWGLVLTSILFGLLHIDPPHAVAACVLGLSLHFAYLTTRSLLMPMLMHFVNNAGAVVASSSWSIPPLKALDEATTDNPLAVGMAALLLLAAAGYALYSCRARLVPLPGQPTAWQPAFPGVAYPPADSETVVVRPWPSMAAWSLVIVAAAVFELAVYFSKNIPFPWLNP